jgi:hypothetical protein
VPLSQPDASPQQQKVAGVVEAVNELLITFLQHAHNFQVIMHVPLPVSYCTGKKLYAERIGTCEILADKNYRNWQIKIKEVKKKDKPVMEI